MRQSHKTDGNSPITYIILIINSVKYKLYVIHYSTVKPH